MYKKEIKNLTINFQKALIQCSHKKALEYQNKYRDIIQEMFLDISLNIDKKEYFEQLFLYEKSLEAFIYPELQQHYIAIMLKQKNIHNEKELLNILQRCFYCHDSILDTIKNSKIYTYSLEQLLTTLKIKIIETNKTKELIRLCKIAEETNDIGLSKKLIQDDLLDDYQKYYLIRNLAFLSAKEDSFKAAEILKSSKIQEIEDLNEIKYIRAKELSKTHLKQAQKIIDEIKEVQYKFSFYAYFYASKNDTKSIIKLISSLDDLKSQNKIDEKQYDNTLLVIGFEIVDNFPNIASSIENKLYTNWGTVLDLEEKIAIAKAKQEPKNMIQFINTLGIDIFQANIIIELLVFYKEHDLIIDTLINKIIQFENVVLQYNLLYQVSKITNKNVINEIEMIISRIYAFDDICLKGTF